MDDDNIDQVDPNSIWSTTPSLALSAPASLLPPLPLSADLSDLDPYYTPITLGESVNPSSRLELISDSDEPDSPESSPSRSVHNIALASLSLSDHAEAKPHLPSTASSFLGTMFRSASSSSPAPVERNDMTQEKREEYNEKTGIKESPEPSAVASSSSRNPISFASVFRSAKQSTPAIPPSAPRPDVPPKDQEKGKGRTSEEDIQRENVQVVFDFNKFLEQMRTKAADPIAKYLRSFLKEFSRRPPVSTADQIRVINDFLDFIAVKMRSIDPWREILSARDEQGEAEFDMALEAMEKLVMNRVWHLTFTPAIDLSKLPGQSSPTDDLERDHVLSQRIRLFSWVRPCHLDLPFPSTSESASPSSSPELPSTATMERPLSAVETRAKHKERHAQGFIDFAIRELNKINQYKAPRDKLICVLNSCKVIFGLMRHSESDEGADSFIPLLIYIVLKANPEHLVSNIQYIQRFRNPEKLSGEGGYYLSSLNGAISFIETMDATSLSNLTQEEFENEVANAIRSFPVDLDLTTESLRSSPLSNLATTASPSATTTTSSLLPSLDSETAIAPSPVLIHPPNLSFPDATKAFFTRSTDSVERIVSNPLGTIVKIFEQIEGFADVRTDGERAASSSSSPSSSPRARTTYPGAGAGTSTSPRRTIVPRRSSSSLTVGASEGGLDQATKAIDRQVELQRKARLETLGGMFPDLESEVLEMVLLSNGGEMSNAIDCLLTFS